MRVKLTNSDSSGSPVTDTIVVTVDGERYERDVASTGTINVPDEVGEYLVESDDHAVEQYKIGDEDDADSEDEDGDADEDESGPLEALDESDEDLIVDADDTDSDSGSSE